MGREGCRGAGRERAQADLRLHTALPPNHKTQGSANCGTLAKPGPLPTCVNKVLLAHTQFTFFYIQLHITCGCFHSTAKLKDYNNHMICKA